MRDHPQGRVDGSGKKVQLEQASGELASVCTLPQTCCGITGGHGGPAS